MKIIDGVYLLKGGELIRDGYKIRYASSASVLIEDDKIIIVDTSLPGDWDEIKTSLRKIGYMPEDVEIVINTHLHRDHCGCNDFFTKAENYAHPCQIGERRNFKSIQFLKLNRTYILDTPGHVDGHISVVFPGEKNVVVAGDAIPIKDNYYKRLPPIIYSDKKEAIRSMEKIVEIADIIITGHEGYIIC
ncbi:MAG: Hydroxyacylglutathione hydrolase [Candidatus Methanolliviera sp. GoM_asphalt]|nr:MAG: Hydroxyacylglutathione hydrolase [Candidatus Methanolliviera sp. GoM_asphalt]